MIGETSVTKKCEICGKVKPIEEFSKSYRNRCKQCVAEQTRVQRGLNKIQKNSSSWTINNVTSIDKLSANEAIEASIRIITNELDFRFMNFPKQTEIVSEIVNDYRREITEWLNDKTKEL